MLLRYVRICSGWVFSLFLRLYATLFPIDIVLVLQADQLHLPVYVCHSVVGNVWSSLLLRGSVIFRNFFKSEARLRFQQIMGASLDAISSK